MPPSAELYAAGVLIQRERRYTSCASTDTAVDILR